MRENRSLGNGGFDMQDDNAVCDANSWLFNVFGDEDVAGGGAHACLQ
jgi:hypothetical protein